MKEKAKTLQIKLQSIRRQLHMFPELAYNEFRTAELIKDELKSMGISFKSGIAGTGIVGYLGNEKPTIALRADMDALPIQEDSSAPYASQIIGVMHACGHDSHVACLLGAAELLSKEEFPGSVRLIFQPSEESVDFEGKSGGRRMVEEGVLEGTGAVIALHIDASSPPGMVKIVEGPMLASMDQFELVVKGKGCHGAYPHKGLDPIFISTQVLNFIYGVVSRNINPSEKALISIGKISGGSASNIIPSHVEINGTIRAFNSGVRNTLIEHIRKVAELILNLGGSYKLRFTGGFPVTVNDPAITGMIKEIVKEMLGEDSLLTMEPQMGSEDFGFYLKSVPGSLFYLGAALPDESRHIHHSPKFDIDDSILYIGSAILAEAATRWLKNKKDLKDLQKT